MDPGEVVLSVVKAAGIVPGKTVLQKLCYFVNDDMDAGLTFRPHYFGPYSSDVSKVTDKFVALDLIQERILSGTLAQPKKTPGGSVLTEWRQHNFSLTDEGILYLDRLEKGEKKDVHSIEAIVGKLKETIGFDSNKLSITAKVHFLLKTGAKAEPRLLARLAATEHEWKLDPGAAKDALAMLQKMK